MVYNKGRRPPFRGRHSRACSEQLFGRERILKEANRTWVRDPPSGLEAGEENVSQRRGRAVWKGKDPRRK